MQDRIEGFFTSFVERFLDALAIFLLMFVAMAAPGFPPDPIVWDVSLGAWIRLATVALGLVLALMVLMLLFPKAFWMASRCFKPLDS